MTKPNKKAQYTVEELQSLVKKVCYEKQISKYHFHFGPKKYTQHQFVALLILFARSGKSFQGFIDSLYESKWPVWLSLKDIPSKSSLHNHFQRIGLKIVRKLNRIVTKHTKTIEHAIDSTGLDIRHSSKHYEKRIHRTCKPWQKLSILAQNHEPYLIEDFVSEQSHTHDVNHARVLIKRNKTRKVFADKGYDSEELRQICYEKGSILYCPTRKWSAAYKMRGKHRKKMKKLFEKKVYNKGRNPVELIMFLLKHNGLIIRTRKRRNQIKEIAWKILAYNVQRLAKTLERWIQIISLDIA